MAGPNAISPSDFPDLCAEPFANPGDQPEPPDAAARGLTRRKVRHVASGETFHLWCAPGPKLLFDDEPTAPQV